MLSARLIFIRLRYALSPRLHIIFFAWILSRGDFISCIKTSFDTSFIVLLSNFSLLRISRVFFSLITAWPLKCEVPFSSVVLASGFPKSWKNIVRRKILSLKSIASTAWSVCSNPPYLWYFVCCSHSISGASSGINTSITAWYFRITSVAYFPVISFVNSTCNLSFDTSDSRRLFFSMLSDVLFSIVNPSSAEKRTARIILSASSEKRVSGSPTHRIILLFKSSLPPKASIILSSQLQQSVFIVKSRLERSSLRLSDNDTVCGWRWSV